MKKIKSFSLLFFGISTVSYFLAIVLFRGAYDEVVGETIIFGKVLTVHRSWGECFMCIGGSLLFMLLINVIAFTSNGRAHVGNVACEEIDLYDANDLCRECDIYDESDLYIELSTASCSVGNCLKFAILETLKFFPGVMVLFVEGVMFGALLLGKCHYDDGGEVILLLSCIAMIIYAVIEVTITVQKEMKPFH